MTSKRIYPAGPSAKIEQIESYIAALKSLAWTISFDWTAVVRGAGGEASPEDPIVRRSAARADLDGVATANVFWLIQPDATSTSTGAWVELGYALAIREEQTKYHAEFDSNDPILKIVVSGTSMKCIFADLADFRFQSHDDAFEFITKDLGR